MGGHHDSSPLATGSPAAGGNPDSFPTNEAVVDDPCNGQPARLIWRDWVRPDPAGEQWLLDYDSSLSVQIRSHFRTAFTITRRGDLESAARQFAASDRILRDAWPEDSSVFMVLRRVLLGAQAYFHFRRQDANGAIDACDEACDLFRQAIETDRFLTPLAYHVPSLRLQQARVYHMAHQWDEMHATVAEVRGMATGDHPLFTFSSGSPMDVNHLCAFMEDVPRQTGHHREFLRCFQQIEARTLLLDKFLLQTHAMPWVVIRYR